ncbi:MAG: ribonuclease Z [Kiritimatiellia bacterium]
MCALCNRAAPCYIAGMSNRELIILGTASQVPTRTRNHNGAFLRWDDVGLLFDPGEGTQRQMTHYGVKTSSINHICITHFHGDHCLGLPGIVQRIAHDGVSHAVNAWYPASGAHYFDRLRHASIYAGTDRIVEHGIGEAGIVFEDHRFRLEVRALDHRVPTWGYRLQEAPRVSLDTGKLAELGLRGPVVGRLKSDGYVVHEGRRIELSEVSVTRPGQSFAIVQDSRPCDGALELARGVDLLLCEATFLSAEAKLADEYGHMTAHQAATLAKEAGVGSLVLSQFSQRYQNVRLFADEAKRVFDKSFAAVDGLRISMPSRA